MRNYRDGYEYAKDLIENIRAINVTLPSDERPMEPEVIDILEKLIYEACKESYKDYLSNERESMLLTDMELKGLFVKATEEYTDRIVMDMVEDELLNMSIGDNGEILYSLSEKGRRAAERYEEGYDD